MVVVEKLTKETHFIPIKSTRKTVDIAHIFMKENFKPHGSPKTIIFDRDVKFYVEFIEVNFQGPNNSTKFQHNVPSSNRWTDIESK